jgi:hypothetical protein
VKTICTFPRSHRIRKRRRLLKVMQVMRMPASPMIDSASTPGERENAQEFSSELYALSYIPTRVSNWEVTMTSIAYDEGGMVL